MAKRKARQPKNENQLDIVIPVYGQSELLQKCLSALNEATQGVDYRLFVVDDCGPEQEQLSYLYNSLNGTTRILRNAQNSGFARTVNTGVSYGNAPYILILNSDVILQPGAIPAMLKEFEDNDVGIVGCKLIFADGRWGNEGRVQHAGICRNVRGELIHINLGWKADHPKVNERREMQMVTGACMMVRRATWKVVTDEYRRHGDPTKGAFNEVYDKGAFEDVELCLAARAQGYKVIYTPEAEGLHYVGASVTGAGEGFPLGRNALIFGARCGHLVEYDEWKYL